MTLPDLPTALLTESEASTTYLPLVGGTLTGDLVVSEATPTVSLKLTADTQPRSRLTDTALGFGPGGTTAPDATLSRTGAAALRVDTHLGVGVNPFAWHASLRGVDVGLGAAFWSDTAGLQATLSANTVLDATSAYKALVAGPAAVLRLDTGTFSVLTAPSVAAGATQAFATRAQVTATGALNLTPDVGAVGLVVERISGPTVGGAHLRLVSPAGLIYFDAPGGGVSASSDNAVASGAPSLRWSTVYAVAGAINTSSREVKEGITPLDPARAMQAVRSTEAVTFDYKAPERGPEWYDLPDDPEQAEQVLAQRLTAAPLEAAARHQHGFIAETCDELFLVGEGQTSPGSSIGILLAALQQLDQRVQALEGA